MNEKDAERPAADLLSEDLHVPIHVQETDNDYVPASEPLAAVNRGKVDFSDLDKGWAWVVLVASFGICSILGGAMFTVGIIHATLQERYHGSTLLTSIAGAFHTALISVAGPVSSAVSDRFSCRTAIVTAGFMYVVGYLGTAFAPNIETAIFTCGIVSGTAGGLAYTANTVVVSYYFRKRRNLAIGISNSGIGAGLFLFAPLMQFLRDFYGPIGFFIIMAGIFSNLITLGALCFPSKLELHTKKRRQLVRYNRMNYTRKSSSISPLCTLLLRYWSILTNKGIFCYCVANFCFCTAIYLIYLHFPNFICYKGFSKTEAATSLSVSGVFNIVSRLLCGMLANSACINDIVLYSGTMGIISLISFIYPLIAKYYIGHVAYFTLLGLFLGPSVVMATSISLKFVPVESVATALSLQILTGGIGAIIGPVFSGMLIDSSFSYDLIIFIAASLVAVAAVIGGVTYFFEPRPLPQEEYYIN